MSDCTTDITGYCQCHHSKMGWLSQITVLETERDRYKEALDTIERMHHQRGLELATILQAIFGIAKQALEGPKEKE